MNWFKAIPLLGLLALTWSECDRPPMTQTHAWPKAAFEPGSTNAPARPNSHSLRRAELRASELAGVIDAQNPLLAPSPNPLQFAPRSSLNFNPPSGSERH